MKCLISMISLMISLSVFSQSGELTGSYTYPDLGQGTYYTKVNWKISYLFLAKGNEIHVRWSNPTISVATDSKYYYHGKTYSKSELGIEAWPEQQQQIAVMTFEAFGSYNGGTFKYFTTCDDFQCDGYFEKSISASSADLRTFKFYESKNFHYNAAGDYSVNEIIESKLNQTASGVTSEVGGFQPQSSDHKESGSISTTSNKSGKSAIQDNEAAKKTLQAQSTQIVAESVIAILNMLGDDAEDREAQYQKAQKEQEKRDENLRYREEQLSQLLNLHLAAANDGEEKQRMILIHALLKYKLQSYNLDYMLPDWKIWVKEAALNNNPEAILLVGYITIHFGSKEFNLNHQQALELLNYAAASLDNADAMFILGDWYTRKKTAKSSGGEDEKQAFLWFSRAAEKGYPEANFALGKIYAYQQILDPIGVKFKVKKDYARALNFFHDANDIAFPLTPFRDIYRATFYPYSYAKHEIKNMERKVN